MCRRNRRWKKIQYRNAAKNCLHNDGEETGDSELLHPTATVNHERDNRNSKREQDGEAGQHAMSVFVQNASHHPRHAEGMKTGGPVRNGSQSRFIAGDERAGNDHKKGRIGREQGVIVMRLVVRSG